MARGTTFVFSDIEGSTQLLQDLRSSYGLALRVHRRILESCFEAHGGSSMGTEGDGVFSAFTSPAAALAAAVEAQQKIEHYTWPDGMTLRVRMGVHVGPATISDGEYVGLSVHEVARICAAAHGGQILCSGAVVQAVGPRSAEAAGEFRDLGSYRLRGIPEPHRLFQLCVAGLDDDFPPPREAARDGGVRVTIWRRAADQSPAATVDASVASGPPSLDICTVDGQVLDGNAGHGEVQVEIRRASTGGADSFRLVVRRAGVIEEEYDGLTLGGASDAAAVVNAHSRLIRVGVRAS